MWSTFSRLDISRVLIFNGIMIMLLSMLTLIPYQVGFGFIIAGVVLAITPKMKK